MDNYRDRPSELVHLSRPMHYFEGPVDINFALDKFSTLFRTLKTVVKAITHGRQFFHIREFLIDIFYLGAAYLSYLYIFAVFTS